MSEDSQYTPPEVWTWCEPTGGTFANINRPVAGATHDKQLPIGKHPLQLYSLATPNGMKASIMLEELLAMGHGEAEYDAWPIRIGDGDQFSSGFVEVNPNSKIPALVDRSGAKPLQIFESGAILLYLSEKFGNALLPADQQGRVETLSWLFWQVGSAPYVGGGFGHFYAYAPEKIAYAINRFTMETKRQLDVLNRRLDGRPYIAGENYSIADVAIYPWYGGLVRGALYNTAHKFLSVHDYPHLQRWANEVAKRPAVIRGSKVNRLWGDAEDQVPERHSAADIDSVLTAGI